MGKISTFDSKERSSLSAANNITQSWRQSESRAAGHVVQQCIDCGGSIQRQEDEDLMQGKFPVQRQEDEDLMQGKFPAQREEDEDMMQGKFAAQRQEEEDLMQGEFPIQRQEKDEGSSGIPPSVQTKMESTLNTNLSDVSVHPNSNKATDVGALAYTQGTDIHIAPGQYNPGTSSGNKLLGHELTHVAQQKEGRVQPTGEIGGLPLNDSPALEKEADDLGSKAN